VLLLLVTGSAILISLIMEAICSTETTFPTTATWHDIPEDGILHSHRRENVISYILSRKFYKKDNNKVTLKWTRKSKAVQQLLKSSYLIMTLQGINIF
jgi:hypothetical protein